VTAHDRREHPLKPTANLFTVQGDISSEDDIARCIAQARAHFGPIHILSANAGTTDEQAEWPIWKMPAETWDKIYAVNVRGTFFTVKHFLASAELSQNEAGGKELENLAIVVTGSECGKFGQAWHAEYASGKAGLQYGLVRGVKNEIVRLNARARINAVAPGWVDTKLIGDRLEDPKELYAEAQATVALRKIAKPQDVARTVAFLASHRAAGHISGECVSVDGGMEGRLVWREEEVLGAKGGRTVEVGGQASASTSIAPSLAVPMRQRKKPIIKVLISVDFDAVSGWLGTGRSPENNMADYSAGFFSARVGVPRLLKLFEKLGIADKITWFIPGHSIESFPEQTKSILDTGCELGLHGYTHEGAPQLTESQEREVLEKCIELATNLTGKKPKGYRAPLYQLRETTVKLLEEHGFLYDTSLTHHDSQPYYLPRLPPVELPDFAADKSARSWMHPLPAALPPTDTTLVEIPCNWYAEDMTPMQFWPHTPNSMGYVDARVVERMWKDKFEFLRGEVAEMGHGDGDEDSGMTVFPLVLHPDTSGMAHVVGMVERMLMWLKGWDEEVEFVTFGECAASWKNKQTS